MVITTTATDNTSTSTSISDMEGEHSRAVGGGLPASPPSSPLPHAHSISGRSDTPICVRIEVHTDISIRPFDNFVTFSAQTCSEILPTLTDEQLDFEIRFNNEVLGRNIDFNSKRKPNRNAKLGALTKKVAVAIKNDFKDIFHECESFSDITNNLSRSIGEAQKFLSEFKAPTVTKEDDETDIFYDCSLGDFQLPEPVRVLDFNVGDGITVEALKSNINFKKYGARKVAHHGPVKYSYGGIAHPACPFPDSEALNSITTRLQQNMPDFDITDWCCMATLYENGKSHIPPHSDNEDSILPDSDIYTVSIGSQRTLTFQNIVGPLLEQRRIDLTHGSVHCMSRASQDSWEHSIPQAPTPNCGPRISLTFRKLKEAPRPTIPPIGPPRGDEPRNSVPTPTVEATPGPTDPKRLLMLSDSLHVSFPARLFDKNSVVCIKKRLPNFCLSDIHLFEGEFQYTDFVFISCGVNDLSRYNWNSKRLYSYFENVIGAYRNKFPRTKFIFNSVLLTDFSWPNSEIDKFNNDVFNYTLQRDSNVWFFDSHHIAESMYKEGVHVIETKSRRANGVHITYAVSDEIRSVIAKCINAWSANRSCSSEWPIRPEFRSCM